MTEYVRQAALPYDWALKSPASIGPCCPEKVQGAAPRNFAGGDWTFCSYFVLVGHLLWEVIHDRRETARSDQALERTQEARGAGRGRAPYPDPGMLFGEGQSEARGVIRIGGARCRYLGTNV